MVISEKLAYEIYIISIFHITALLVLLSFSLYIYYRAKRRRSCTAIWLSLR